MGYHSNAFKRFSSGVEKIPHEIRSSDFRAGLICNWNVLVSGIPLKFIQAIFKCGVKRSRMKFVQAVLTQGWSLIESFGKWDTTQIRSSVFQVVWKKSRTKFAQAIFMRGSSVIETFDKWDTTQIHTSDFQVGWKIPHEIRSSDFHAGLICNWTFS